MRLRPGTLAVVTGAGSGIGLAVARALAGRGCRVALLDVREDRLEAARAALAAGGPVAGTYRVDVRDEPAIGRAAAEIRQAHGPAAVLVNSAGVAITGPFADTAPDALDWVVDVNFAGTVRCCRVFLPQLREAGTGHIVNVGSCFGWVGFPGMSGYCASKFAVRGFSEALRAELAPHNIGVTVAYPGAVDTNLVRDGRLTDEGDRAREVAFLASRAIPADRVARRIVSAIEWNSARVLVRFDYRAIDLLVRLMPSWSLSLLAWLGRRKTGGAGSAG